MTNQTPATDLYQSGPANSDLFLRKWSLTLLGPNGQSWTLSDSNQANAQSGGTSTVDDALRITFETKQVNVSSRGSLQATVFNLKLVDISNLKQLYNRVILQVGYQNGPFGTIFDGQIIWFQQGRTAELVDTFLTIFAQDGEFPYNLATASLSFARGTNASQVVTGIAQSMINLGAKMGKINGMSETPLIRGMSFHGMAVDGLLKFGQTNIQNGVLNVFDPRKNFPVGNPIKFDGLHGLVGMAEVTTVGVEFNALINPNLQVHSTVVIDEKSINEYAVGSGPGNTVQGGGSQFQGPGITQLGWFANVAADGQYSVVKVEYSGDSRGNPWYMHVTAWPYGQGPSPGIPADQLPFYDQGPTSGQITTATETPNLPATPTPAFPTVRSGTGPTQIPPGG